MSEERTFDARIIGSILSGRLLVEEFGELHGAIEYLTGHPVWTHEIGGACANLRFTLDKQYPEFPKLADDDWQAYAARLLKQYPMGVSLPRGSAVRTTDPVSTFRKLLDEPENKTQQDDGGKGNHSDAEWVSRIRSRLQNIEQSLSSYRGCGVSTRRLEDWCADLRGLRMALVSIENALARRDASSPKEEA